MTLDEVKAAMQAAQDALNSLDVGTLPVDPEAQEVDVVMTDGSTQKFVPKV